MNLHYCCFHVKWGCVEGGVCVEITKDEIFSVGFFENLISGNSQIKRGMEPKKDFS